MLSARFQLRQSQSLALTPQLLQSIRLLHYSHAELDAFVQAQVERNPLLERGGEPLGGSPSGRIEDRSPVAGRADDPAVASSSRADGSRPTPIAGRGERFRGPAVGTVGAADDSRFIESLADDRPSLAAHALAEAADACRDPHDRRIGEFLVGCLDEAGYLDCDLAAVAIALGARETAVEAVLARLQDAAEPAGLFARGLAECLAIQLRRANRLDPVMARVLDNLELLARRDFAALKRITGEDEAGLADILAEIRRLDPKPGHGFGAEGNGAIVPDVVVRPAPDGTWTVELNPDALPRVLVNERYAARVAPALAGADRAFLSECLASANWLARSLDQRARTVLKVATEIVRRQDGFLTRGIAGLKPMTLMAVAESIGVHESTVSRATSNKFVATPRGTFDMKFFFTVAIAATGGGACHSAESVKHRIRALVNAESASAVLSDDEIAERLRGEGVDLARRTVAKYREALGIPCSVRRRRETNARRLAS